MGLTVIIFVVVLGLLIFVHELGHFLMARRMGVKVEEFGFGFPPRMFGVRRGDTTYSINWIPLGGFVKIKGEQGDHPTDQDSFTSKKVWQRFLILSAGVGMNIVLAFVLISIGFMIGLPSVVDQDGVAGANVRDLKIQIVEVQDQSPAAQAGLAVGDTILRVDDQPVTTITVFQNYTKEKNAQPMTLLVKRGGEERIVTVTPTILEGSDHAVVGIGLVESGLISYAPHLAIWEGLKTTGMLLWRIIEAFYTVLRNLIIGVPVGADIAGPIGIAVLTGQVAKLGFIYILQFTALLSLNLAVINFLPIPALDGGRVLFLIIEKIRGKAINRKIEATVHNVGFFVLIGLVILVTFRDVSRFSEQIKNFFHTIF